MSEVWDIKDRAPVFGGEKLPPDLQARLNRALQTATVIKRIIEFGRRIVRPS